MSRIDRRCIKDKRIAIYNSRNLMSRIDHIYLYEPPYIYNSRNLMSRIDKTRQTIATLRSTIVEI